MHIKLTQKFESKQSGTQIKVVKIQRSTVDSRFDRCTIGNTLSGKVIQGTQRVVQADSIRRRYW